ncbi:hypothetical protein J1605_005974 [Eschrichtius robustus]|uniref:RNA-binding protein Luc7-like 1 n=1 Tax=Eschrichtius robustus TaxID=9764 RepID=A0AB34H6D4_ESCRO|nr:hypothetical protein J1605_005974 [Eschrichtius robustus]
MSAQAQMRALLDQLMGTARDGDETRQRVKFTDDRVCKSHLLDCCPHDILAGTRMDLGECTKIHDLALRADYEIASKERDLFFELDAMDHLESFIAECDRRTELAKKRLAETQEEISAEVSAKEEYRNSMPASSFQQQKLRVCEVCSAYLGLHDNDRRLADHFGGKLHLGFIQIREKLDQLRVWIKNQRSQEVALPGPASEAVKIYLQRAAEVIPIPVPRQTPAPPKPFPEPQPRPPPGIQGPEFSRERASREESWERGRSERGATDWRLESTNGKTASRRSEEKEAGEI